MSRVFVAEEVALGRRVVVKVLAPELAEGLSAERFAREARLAARLHGDFSFFDDLLSRARARAATETDRNFLSQMQFNLAMEAGQAGRAARIAADLPNRLAERMFAATFWDGDSTAGAAQYAEARALVSARPPAEPNARHAWITTIFDVAQYELARGDTTNAARADAGQRLNSLDSLMRLGPIGEHVRLAGNLVASRLLERAGNVQRAYDAALRWAITADPAEMSLNATYLCEQGRLGGLAGDREAAIMAYRRYLRLRARQSSGR